MKRKYIKKERKWAKQRTAFNNVGKKVESLDIHGCNPRIA
jgi:hypothetical protein